MNERQLIERRGAAWPQKRVLVCGPTDYVNWDIVKASLQAHRPTMIVHGHATGVDHLASMYAQLFHIDELRFPALWRVHGASAPLVRNELMFRDGKPDLLLLFPGGFNGNDVQRRAVLARIPLVVVNDADWVNAPMRELEERQRARA